MKTAKVNIYGYRLTSDEPLKTTIYIGIDIPAYLKDENVLHEGIKEAIKGTFWGYRLINHSILN